MPIRNRKNALVRALPNAIGPMPRMPLPALPEPWPAVPQRAFVAPRGAEFDPLLNRTLAKAPLPRLVRPEKAFSLRGSKRIQQLPTRSASPNRPTISRASPPLQVLFIPLVGFDEMGTAGNGRFYVQPSFALIAATGSAVDLSRLRMSAREQPAHERWMSADATHGSAYWLHESVKTGHRQRCRLVTRESLPPRVRQAPERQAPSGRSQGAIIWACDVGVERVGRSRSGTWGAICGYGTPICGYGAPICGIPAPPSAGTSGRRWRGSGTHHAAVG
jgi:hypothetical protein